MRSFAQGMHGERGMMGEGRRGMMGEALTPTEQTALTSMTATEKKAFFDKKLTDMKTKRDAHEIVIDKLLAGTVLTADEEAIRQEIIKNRADMKAKRTQMETIKAKKAAGTALTAEEQALLDSMPKMNGKRGHEGSVEKKGPRRNTSTLSGTVAQ